MGTVTDRPPREWLRPLGSWLLVSGAALAALSVFSALVPLEVGVWPRFEPGRMALYLAAGICAAALVVVWLADRAPVEAALGHPLVLAATFLALVGAVLATVADHPWLSILGYPLIGDGVLRYAAMAVLFAAAIVIRGDALGFRLLLVLLLVGSVAGTAALYWFALEDFPSLDIAGVLVIAAWVGAWYLTPERWGVWRFGVGLAAIALILLASTNNTALISVFAIALPASMLVWYLLERGHAPVRLIRVAASLALVVLPFAGIVAVWLIPEITEAFASVTSRKFIHQIVFAALGADPSIFLTGQGWGRTVATLDEFRTASDAVLWDGSWDGATRPFAHAHNYALEALLGGGVVGVAGLLAIFAAPVIACGPRDLPAAVFAAAVFAGLSTSGPQVAMAIGPTALALAIAGAGPPPTTLRNVAGRGLTFVLPVVSASLLGAGLWLIAQGIDFRNRVADVRAKGVESAYFCRLHPNSGTFGDLVLAQGFTKAYRPVLDRAVVGEHPSESEHNLIAAYLCNIERRSLRSESPSMQMAAETFRSFISANGAENRDIARYSRALADWPGKLARMLNAAPNRTDMTVGFFEARIESGAWETVGSLANALHDFAPEDPVANWYLGRFLLTRGGAVSTNAGYETLRTALNNGIKKIILVIPAFEADILERTGGETDEPAAPQ